MIRSGFIAIGFPKYKFTFAYAIANLPGEKRVLNELFHKEIY